MKHINTAGAAGLYLACAWMLIVFPCAESAAQPARGKAAVSPIIVLELEGTVETSRAGAVAWSAAATNEVLRAGDRIRTGARSRAALRWSDASMVRVDQLSILQIEPPAGGRGLFGWELPRGVLYFFHRERPADVRFRTRTATAAVRGTEFNVEAREDGTTVLTVFDGVVELRNNAGFIDLNSGEQGIATPGVRPTKTAVIDAINVIQWCLYYPAVLHAEELALAPAELQALNESLAAYRTGDLLQALAKYPDGRQPASSMEQVYLAAVLLSVGRVDQSKALIDPLAADPAQPQAARLASALGQLVAAVKRQPWQRAAPPELATEWLGESYYRQANGDLKGALDAARMSVDKAPSFGFGWARVAELEFSFGRIGPALEALDKSLELAPRNAEALALKGFLLGAQNRIRSAIEYFDRALEIDGALGNAWLGRGLCQIRLGRTEAGLEDLQMAATVEPQRALLRSYLGKAYGTSGERAKAAQELQLAKSLDSKDPTAWFYSALLHRQDNEFNEAVRDLLRSQALNENRNLYRSRLLLDQDEGARSANLARLYADAGLADVALREAGRGVSADYANYSSHLFLANSYETQRRESLSTLRFEAPAFSEYLLANLLGPASGRLLSQPVTQLEYSQLFEQDGLGLIASTEYFSRGAWRHSSAQHGTFGALSYSLEAEYLKEPGERPNEDLEIRQLEAKVKYDVTPNDSLLFHVIDYRANGGDIAQRFDASEVDPLFRFCEEQSPTVLAGYHHQWSPESHTLLLGGRFDDTLRYEDPLGAVFVLDRTFGMTNGMVPADVGHSQRSRVQVWSAEAQQLTILGRHSLIAGARLQWSEQDVSDRVENPFGMWLVVMGTNNPIRVESIHASAFIASVYAYDYVRLAERLRVVGGLNFTYQDIPVNTATAPVTSARDSQERLSPKAGIIWTPAECSEVRASYTRSLNGSGLGQSVRLEPTHVAGLIQAFRSPAPPALVGDLDGADVETAEVVWEGRFQDTFLSVGWQRLAAERTRKVGLFLTHPVDYDLGPSAALLREEIDFTENTLDVSAHQLAGRGWSFGARYRLSYAELNRSYPEYREPVFLGGLEKESRSEGWLHTVELSVLYRHSSGLFGRADGNWFSQERHHDGAGLIGDRFWQINLLAGYRFARQRGEVALGVLNLIGDDYRLDPINQHSVLPRSRTFYARVLLNF